MKETVEERTILEKKVPEGIINGKDAMTVQDVDEFERHTGSAFHGIFVPTGRTKAAVTAKGNKLQVIAVGTGEHGTAKRGITTV